MAHPLAGRASPVVDRIGATRLRPWWPRGDRARTGRGDRTGAGTGPVPRPRRPGTRPLLALAALCATLFTAVAVTVAVRHGAPLAPRRPSTAGPWRTAGTAALDGRRTDRHRNRPGPVPDGRPRGPAGRPGRARTAARGRLRGRRPRRRPGGPLRPDGNARPAAADDRRLGRARLRLRLPSGHATTSALAAGLLAWGIARYAGRGPARTWCAVLALWAVAVGLTRVWLGVHWPGDVLGGWLLAGTVLSLALLLERYVLPDRYAAVGLPESGGAGPA
ncbi:phosphatase PAP2 family protein [Streptomyces lydicus]|nr:phosphatase PAP2 family protein [Streptomyces lydicus]